MTPVIELLCTAPMGTREDRHRCWVEMGRPLAVAPNLAATVSADRQDQAYQLRIELLWPGGGDSWAVPPDGYIDCRDYLPLRLVPRAWERVGGRPRRVLMDFVRTRADVLFLQR